MSVNKLQPIGDVIYTNSDGFLIKNVSKRTVYKPLNSLIKEVVLIAKEVLENNLHSVYIRGSVAKGTFIPNISDLDSVFVVKNEITNDLYIKLQKKLIELNKLYPEVTTIECNVQTLNNILSSTNPIYKYQMVCIFGNDITSHIPELMPGRDSTVHLSKIIKRIDNLSDNTESHNDPIWIKSTSIWMCKLLIRSCHELIAGELQQFARDIYPCYIAASNKWPKDEPLLRRVAEIAVYGTEDKSELLIIAKKMKNFLQPKITAFYQ